MNQSVELNENVLFRRVLNEGVVVDQRKAQVMVVNEVAVRILELIRQSCPVKTIISTLTAEYDASAADIESDLARFLEQIEQQGLTDTD